MEKKIFNISIPINCHGYRIDKFLQSQFNNLSRTRLQNLIRDGYVKINDAIIQESSKKIKNDDKIEIQFPNQEFKLIGISLFNESVTKKDFQTDINNIGK